MSTTNRNNRQHGIAMMVVLGVLVLVSMIGFVALTMSGRDHANAGSLVDIKSQRMTAIAGLNLSISRMQFDANQTAAQIKEFTTNPTKKWLKFSAGTSTFTLTADEPDWFPLGDDSSACKVMVLGVASAQIDNALPIQFLSRGRGRNGDVFEVKGTYLIRGLDYVLRFPTKGPTDGLLARGGLTNIDAAVNVDAGIYSGGTGVTKIQSSQSSCSFTRVRTRGDLEVYANATITGNSIVGGKLKIENGKTATFGNNLVVGYANQNSSSGGIEAAGSGTLTVAKSLYIHGTAFPSPWNVNLTVGKDLWISNTRASFSGSVTVGTIANEGNSWFDKGLSSKNGGTYIYNGRVDVGSAATGDHTLEGWTYILKDLNLWKNGGAYSRLQIFDGALYVNGSLASDGSLNSNNNSPSGTMPSVLSWATATDAPIIQVNGKSWLGNGIKMIDRNPGMVFKDEVHSRRATLQKTFANGYAEFWKPIHLNSSLDAAFGTSGQAWRFAAGSAVADRTWKYTGSGFDGRILNGAGSGQTSDDANFNARRADIVPNRVDPPTISDLGYSQDELNIDLADNPATEVKTDRLYDKMGNKADLDYEAIRANYFKQSKCGFTLANKDAPPSATQLQCIYNDQIKTNGNLLWDSKFMIIRIASNATRFNNLSSDAITSLAENRVLPSGVHIFWIIETGLNINAAWYSNVRGSIQIIEATALLNQFGWSGDFYGFIRMSGAVNYLKAGGPTFNLYGAMEIADENQSILVNSGAFSGLNIYHNDLYVKETMYSDISGSFFSSAGVGTGTDKWIIRFNGDRDKSDIAKELFMDVVDGWIQFERIGEYR